MDTAHHEEHCDNLLVLMFSSGFPSTFTLKECVGLLWGSNPGSLS